MEVLPFSPYTLHIVNAIEIWSMSLMGSCGSSYSNVPQFPLWFHQPNIYSTHSTCTFSWDNQKDVIVLPTPPNGTTPSLFMIKWQKCRLTAILSTRMTQRNIKYFLSSKEITVRFVCHVFIVVYWWRLSYLMWQRSRLASIFPWCFHPWTGQGVLPSLVLSFLAQVQVLAGIETRARRKKNIGTD